MNLVCAAILAWLAPAAAVVAPVGWKVTGLDAHAKETGVIDAATKAASIEQYMPVGDDPGITLIVTRVTASDLRGARELAVRAVADELRASGAVAPVAANGQLELASGWRDPSLHTQRTTRIVIAASATRLVTVTGECIAREEVPAPLVDACKAALATLDPDVPKADRVALELPAASATPVAAPTPTPSSGRTLEPARLDDGSRVPFGPIVVGPAAPPPADRRPIYIGAGVVLLALVFWWNRRQRDRFEREDGPTPPRTRRRDRVKVQVDADADDLHAAARGDDEATKAKETDDR